MAELEVKAYRFSISWSRILPLGSGKVNQAGPLCDSEVAVAAVALALLGRTLKPTGRNQLLFGAD